MKEQYGTALILIALTLLLSFIWSSGSRGAAYTLNFGLTCCSLGLLWVLIGTLLLITKRIRNIGFGFLISAGLTFLIGTGVCSTLL